MPTSRKAKDQINASKRATEELPRADDPFVKNFTWKEFHSCEAAQVENKEQIRVDLSKADQLWHYLAIPSTETKAQYTEDLARSQPNPKGNFLDSIPKPAPVRVRHTSGMAAPMHASPAAAGKAEKPYIYKPHKPVKPAPSFPHPSQQFASSPATIQTGQQLPFGSDPRFQYPSAPYSATRFAPTAGAPYSSPYGQAPPVNGLNQQPQTPQTPPKSWQAPGQPFALGQPGPYAASGGSMQPSPQPSRPYLSSPAPQTPFNTWQKYPFFQLHHNR